jgi:hypothetical protein
MELHRSMGNVQLHAVTSARLVNEARRPDARILDPLPAGYEAALTSLVGRLPPRNSMVSNDIVSRKVKGPSRSGTALASFGSDKTNAGAIRHFFQNVTATRRCKADRNCLVGSTAGRRMARHAVD